MTSSPLGVSFAPTTENAQQNAQRPPELLPQAIQILSLRLPRVLGAQAPSSDALLRGGGGGQENSSVVSAVVQSVLQSVLGSTPPPAPSAPGAAAGGIPSSPSALSAPTEAQGVQSAVQTFRPGKPSVSYQDQPPSGSSAFPVPGLPFSSPAEFARWRKLGPGAPDPFGGGA